MSSRASRRVWRGAAIERECPARQPPGGPPPHPTSLERVCERSGTLLVMDLQLLRTAQPDGKLAYGRDSTGRPVALLPGMCKRGLHMLAPSEYRAVVRDGEVHISCPACAADGADHCWRLTTGGSIPDRAELDDETYRELILDRARATSPWAGGPGAQ